MANIAGDAVVKLTVAQKDALRLIAAGTVRKRNCGTSAWRIFGASPTVVGRLIQILKLAEWSPDKEGYVCTLTSAGDHELTVLDSAED